MVQYPSNSLDVLFAFVLSIDKDVIEVHYDKNIELLYQDLVDVTLECSRCIGQLKGYYLILEMTIAGLESYLPFIAFLDPHLMVDIGQIELGETSSQT